LQRVILRVQKRNFDEGSPDLKTFQLPENAALIVASDAHIKTEHDERYLLLCSLVESALAKGAKGLVLNGDIFDFFFGWSHYFQNKYRRLLDGLDALAKSGALVWFVQGNHEFGMEPLGKTFQFEILSSEGRVWTGPQGQKILITHGDLLKRDLKYELFRAFIRSKFVSIIAFLTPQRLLDRMTLWFARTSRKKDKYRVLRHEQIAACAKSVLDESRTDAIIFGHFHHPYDEKLDDGRRILSVTSWSEPSCIIIEQDGSVKKLKPV
jgi:UDP-2,3-diacylglucosamine hydrolase